MAVRKSKLIGTVINGYLIKDSKHVGNDTKLLVQCQSCGYEGYKSRTFVKNGASCPSCQSGKNYHNAKGYQHERLYERYMSILRRVKGKEHYKDVEICEEWLNDYLSFRKWALNNGYSDNLTIDRIDNSKGYSPDNCRWADNYTQANNRRSNRYLEYNGKKMTYAEWERYLDFPKNVICQRVKKGWSVEDIILTPYKSRKKWSEMNET